MLTEALNMYWYWWACLTADERPGGWGILADRVQVAVLVAIAWAIVALGWF